MTAWPEPSSVGDRGDLPQSSPPLITFDKALLAVQNGEI